MPEKYTDVGNNPKDVPANEIAKALKGVDFPVQKSQMVEKARQNNAPSTVVEALRNLPDRNYDSPVDVERAYSNFQGR